MRHYEVSETSPKNSTIKKVSINPQNSTRLVGWSLTELSTQFRSYRAFKVELYYKL